ncbi:MAG: aldehyde dehydrogenase family protein [Planctomycetaceae bacterium]
MHLTPAKCGCSTFPFNATTRGEHLLLSAAGSCGGDFPVELPLFILTGMTVAALVTGNTVVMKPAEQSSIVAAKLFEMIRDSGIPDGVVSYLPRIRRREIGPALVENRMLT